MHYSQIDCWNGLVASDPEALGYVYDTYADRLFEAALKRCSDRELAKDVLQEVFISVWNYRHNFSSVRDPQAYLFSILYHAVAGKMKTPTVFINPDFVQELLAVEETAEQKQIAAEMHTENVSRLKRACDRLTERQRKVITMRFYEGRSHKQIATLLRMNYQSVNNLVFRALGTLKKEF